MRKKGKLMAWDQSDWRMSLKRRRSHNSNKLKRINVVEKV
jgi:hypothetical protein